MSYYVPLIIVGVSLALLWTLGRLLSRANEQIKMVQTAPVRGVEIAPGLHVAGLNDESIQELNSLINARDIDNLSVFLALKKPSLIELDHYIDTLRRQFLQILKTSVNLASEIEKIAATNQVEITNPPNGFNFTQINKAELRTLFEYNPQKRRYINHEFITRFGDKDFMKNFKTYCELVKDMPVTMLVGKDDNNRKQMEVFVARGVALQGRKIPLQDRLSVLKFSQLREMAKELKLDKEFKRRADATQTLAEIPGSAILLAMLVNIDDIFMLKPEVIDNDAVNSEWSVITTYAKLLCERT